MKPSRRSRWYFVLVVLIIAIGAAASAAVMYVLGSESDPARMALPEVVGQGESQGFLLGPGLPLLKLVDASEGLAAGRLDKLECEALVAKLATIGEPPMLHELAMSIPDTVTGDMASEYVLASVDALGTCRAGGAPTTDRLRFARIVFDRRLAEIGVR